MMVQNRQMQTCPNRSVAKDGRIVCKMILSGDNEVSPNLCRECPAKTVACDHLRFSLQKLASRPITVRYATGRVEVLDDQPPRIAFLRAACEEKVAPVNSPLECSRCEVRAACTPEPAVAPAPVPVQRGKVIPFPRRVAAVG
jgi:hypothetical protein